MSNNAWMRRIVRQLQREVGGGGPHPLHAYCDRTLRLGPLLSERMRRLSPEQFENVMHPVFQEDEITLIIAGACVCECVWPP